MMILGLIVLAISIFHQQFALARPVNTQSSVSMNQGQPATRFQINERLETISSEIGQVQTSISDSTDYRQNVVNEQIRQLRALVIALQAELDGRNSVRDLSMSNEVL